MEFVEGKFIPISEYLLEFPKKKDFNEFEKRVTNAVLAYLQKRIDPDITNAKRYFRKDMTPNYAIVGDDKILALVGTYDDATLMMEAIVAASPYYQTVCLFSADGVSYGHCYYRDGITNQTNHLHWWAKGDYYR